MIAKSWRTQVRVSLRAHGSTRCASDRIYMSAVHGQVLEQWPNMFRILGLFCA